MQAYKPLHIPFTFANVPFLTDNCSHWHMLVERVLSLALGYLTALLLHSVMGSGSSGMNGGRVVYPLADSCSLSSLPGGFVSIFSAKYSLGKYLHWIYSVWRCRLVAALRVVPTSRVAMDTSSLLTAFGPPLTFQAPAPKLIISDEFSRGCKFSVLPKLQLNR